MEFVMNGFHLAVLVAIIVTASLVSNLLAIVTTGPARRGASTLLRLGPRRSPRHAKRLVDSWVAGMLARRERQAASWAADCLRGRELRAASRGDARIGPRRRR
jgi:hypothetical protein